MSQNFNRSEPDWLMQRYLNHQQAGEEPEISRLHSAGPQTVPTQSYASIHNTPGSPQHLQLGQKRDSSPSVPKAFSSPHLPTPPQQEVASQS